MRTIKQRGQSAMEYMILVAIIIGAFIGAGVYFKRGIQGRWKAAVDDLGDQYDPRYTNTDILFRTQTNTETRISVIDVTGGYWTMRDDLTNALDTKTGYMRIGAP